MGYETNFRFTGFERIDGAYWVTYVTADPSKVDQALEACREVIQQVGKGDISFREVATAGRAVVKQHENEVRSNAYWASLLVGTQSDAWPHKNLGDLKDFHRLVDEVTAGDLMALVKVIGMGDESQCSP